MDARHRNWRNTSELGSVDVVVEGLDETARAFYLHHEILRFQDHPNRLFLAMSTIEKAFRSACHVTVPNCSRITDRLQNMLRKTPTEAAHAQIQARTANGCAPRPKFSPLLGASYRKEMG